MDAQQIFDTVLTGIRKQGKASFGLMGCAYRGKDGAKCAAGMVIPDHAYVPAMEGSSIDLVLQEYQALAHLHEHRHLLDDLQCAHDSELADHTIAKWEEEMKLIAEQRGLVYA